jgi:RNA polymerase sigma factor (sigma-70 family)
VTTDLDDLVRQAQAGDAAALERVVEAVQDDVHRLCLRMTGNRDDAQDATQETLIRVITRLSTFQGDAAFRTWVHRIAVNHLLDRRRSAVERYELTFDLFAADLLAGLAGDSAVGGPDEELLAREVKHGCTLALLSCLDRDLRVAYVLGEVFEVSSADGAWICGTSEAAYRKRLSRARAAVRHFVGEHCALVGGPRAPCHCRRRVDVAVRLGRVDPNRAVSASATEVAEATAELESLHDAAALVRSLGDDRAPRVVADGVRAIIHSGRYRVLDDGGP